MFLLAPFAVSPADGDGSGFFDLWSVVPFVQGLFLPFPILSYSMVLPSGPDLTTFVFYFPSETPATLGLGFFLLLALVTWSCLPHFSVHEKGNNDFYWRVFIQSWLLMDDTVPVSR